MKRFNELVNACLPDITEVFPWDVEEQLGNAPAPLLLDIREPDEYNAMHIQDSLLVPRGILETACEYNYEETVPELVQAREREIVVVCRSGNRSALAAYTMQLLGYRNVSSMKTGLRGWNDYELPLVSASGRVVPIEEADEFFSTRLRPDQIEPEKQG
jgi:rhodanese-related sulfurtransferase